MKTLKYLLTFLPMFLPVTLSAKSANQVYRMGPTGNIAKWGAVNLSAAPAVTGILPISNGGTGNSSAFTQGSVVYMGASGFTQDNPNFFWDDPNNRLGIGTNAPSQTLHVVGSSLLSGLTLSSSTISSAGTITLSPSSGSSTLSVTSSGMQQTVSSGSSSFVTGQSGTNNGGFIYESGNRMQVKNFNEITVSSSDGDIVIVGTYLAGNLVMGRFYSHGAGLGTLQLPSLSGSEATPNSAGMRADGTIVRESSSKRYKTDVENISIDTSKIYELRPVSFRWKAHPEKQQKDVGLIAEEVYQTIPELAFMARINEKGMYDETKPEIPEAVHYKLLPVLMLSEMKKLRNRIETLESTCSK